MTFDDVRAFAFTLAGVEDGTAYGYPCLKAAGKFLTRVWDDGDTLVCPTSSQDEREMLMQAEPETFHLTDHYRTSAYVLVRLSRVHPGTVTGLLERRWRAVVPRRLLKAHEAATGSAA